MRVAAAIAVATLFVTNVFAQTASQPQGGAFSWPMGTKFPVPVAAESQPAPVASAEQRALARTILDQAEAASGRSFDAAWRSATIDNLSKKPLMELESILRDPSHALVPTPLYLGASQSDLVYTPVTPCRILDTRVAGGPIAAGTSRAFRTTGTNFTAQGGVAGDCGVPFGPATAALINFTAVGSQASGPGNLSVTPHGTAFTSSSIINWTAGTNIANGVSVTLCNPNVISCIADFDIKANVNTVGVAADVLGYFAAPQASGLDVQAVYIPSSGLYYSCAAFNNCVVSVVCNTGFIVTGGGCEVQDSNQAYQFIWTASGPSGNGWVCKGTNTNGSIALGLRGWAMCSRTPGR